MMRAKIGLDDTGLDVIGLDETGLDDTGRNPRARRGWQDILGIRVLSRDFASLS
jgi:hypothetical protein